MFFDRFKNKSEKNNIYFKDNLPKFIIIGAQKSGTTSLYHYLSQHPKILPPKYRKEINYFEKRYFSKSLRWYKSQFSNSTGDSINFEASTNYLFYPWSPKHVFETIPHCKIIILLREPKQRAWSHYKHQIRSKEEQIPFFKALEREMIHLDEIEKKILADPKYFNKSFRNYSYLRRGLYFKQIKNWARFFERESMFISSFDDFFENPIDKCNEIFEFLEIEKFSINPSKIYNESSSNDIPPKESIDLMKSYFCEPNKLLFNYLSKDFNW